MIYKSLTMSLKQKREVGKGKRRGMEGKGIERGGRGKG
jgi:hypothetical protein